MLLQDQGDGLRPCAYESKKLKDAELNYTISEKETYALVFAVIKWRHYLESAIPFTVKTDNSPLTHLMTKATLTRRQARWVEILNRFNFTVEHSSGKSNLADGLSRRPDLLATLRVTELRSDILSRVASAYWDDPWMQNPENRKGFEMRGGIWYKGDSIVIPHDGAIKRTILAELHDSTTAAHRGIEKTLEKVKRLFWWPGLAAEVTDYVRSCPCCQRNKISTQRPAGLLQPLPVPTVRWGDISMDLITQLPRTAEGFDAIFVVVCRLTKMAHFIPTTTKCSGADLVTLFIREIVRIHGMPSVIVSDRDPRWTGHFWRAFFRALGTKLAFSSSYHPQTDGRTERENRTLEEVLRCFVNDRQNDWDVILPMVEYAHNDMEHSSTGATPFFLNYGGHPANPLARACASESVQVPAAQDLVSIITTAVSQAIANLKIAQARQAHYANLHRRELVLEEGQLVWLCATNWHWADGRNNKLRSKRIGPYKVIRAVSPVAYEIELPMESRMHPVFHVSNLTPVVESQFFGTRIPEPPAPVRMPGGEEVMHVEKVLKKRTVGRGRGKRVEYLIRWQ